MSSDSRQQRGHRIKLARKSAGLTQRELADRVGASESTIANVERGAFQHPDPAMMEAIHSALGIASLDADPAAYAMSRLPLDVQTALNVYAGWLMARSSEERAAELEGIYQRVFQTSSPNG